MAKVERVDVAFSGIDTNRVVWPALADPEDDNTGYDVDPTGADIVCIHGVNHNPSNASGTFIVETSPDNVGKGPITWESEGTGTLSAKTVDSITLGDATDPFMKRHLRVRLESASGTINGMISVSFKSITGIK